MRLSVIAPVHNEEANIIPFYERVKKTADALDGVTAWDLLFVNNASDDGSLDQVLRLRERDSRVKVLTLSRNFGYHCAIVAGLTESVSDLYTIVDGDCEDPPELLAEFYSAIRRGAQVAYGIRSHRQEPHWLTLCRGLFYHINRWIADGDVELWMAEFTMITRQVRDAILVSRTTFPFLRSEIGYVGFKRVGIPYLRGKRQHGKSHYNILGMMRFAVGGFLAGSTFPLRVVLYTAAVMAVAFPLLVLWRSFTLVEAAAVGAILTFYFSLLALAMAALYLARTYKNVTARPLYVVDRERTFR